jgi:hypothetical protein
MVFDMCLEHSVILSPLSKCHMRYTLRRVFMYNTLVTSSPAKNNLKKVFEGRIISSGLWSAYLSTLDPLDFNL